MGTENRALVGDALELVVVGVGPYLDRLLADHATAHDVAGEPRVDRDLVSMLALLADARPLPGDDTTDGADDVSPRTIAAYARELQAVWDAWARIRPFDAADTYRALDTAARLLLATGADDEAANVRELATIPLALFASRVLARYVANEDGVADEDGVANEDGAADEDSVADDSTGSDDSHEPDDSTEPDDLPSESIDEGGRDDLVPPVRLRAVNRARHAERVEDARAPASIRALRAVDPALPLVTWSELSDTITALLGTGRIDPQVLAGFTRKSLDERTRAAVEAASARGVTIRAEHVAWVVSVLRARYAGTARVTRAAATALVAEYIAELAPRAGVDPRRVRQDMMAWVDVERA